MQVHQKQGVERSPTKEDVVFKNQYYDSSLQIHFPPQNQCIVSIIHYPCIEHSGNNRQENK